MPRKALIQFRRDTAANWTAANEVLASGEPALETDTGKRKLGDGVTAWTSLAYAPTVADVAAKSTIGHTHVIGDTPGLQAAIDGKVAQTITDGVTTSAPSQDAVFDALALKAPLASPALTGVPTAPTAAPGTNTTQLANAAFVQAALAALVASSPATLDTLNELATALGNDPSFATTMATALGNKQPLDTDLTAIAALTSAANKVLYATGAGTWALADQTAFARTLLDDADAATARITLNAGDLSAPRWVEPSRMNIRQGAPTLGLTSDHQRWLLDATAIESLNWMEYIPAGWATLDIYFWWYPTTANAGDVTLWAGAAASNTASIVAAGVMATISFAAQATAVGPATANQLMRTKITATPLSIPGASGGWMRSYAYRKADGAGDTYPDDIGLVGVEIVRVS